MPVICQASSQAAVTHGFRVCSRELRGDVGVDDLLLGVDGGDRVEHLGQFLLVDRRPVPPHAARALLPLAKLGFGGRPGRRFGVTSPQVHIAAGEIRSAADAGAAMSRWCCTWTITSPGIGRSVDHSQARRTPGEQTVGRAMHSDGDRRQVVLGSELPELRALVDPARRMLSAGHLRPGRSASPVSGVPLCVAGPAVNALA